MSAKKKAKSKKVKGKSKKTKSKVKKARSPSKSEIFKTLAESTGLERKQVTAVFENYSELVGPTLKKHHQILIPGLAKIKLIRKKATKARKGISPFTGEETLFKAKPARNVVRLRPIKALKDMVA